MGWPPGIAPGWGGSQPPTSLKCFGHSFFLTEDRVLPRDLTGQHPGCSRWRSIARSQDMERWRSRRELHPHLGLRRAVFWSVELRELELTKSTPTWTRTKTTRVTTARAPLTLPGYLEMAAGVGIAPTYPAFQTGTNLSQLPSVGKVWAAREVRPVCPIKSRGHHCQCLRPEKMGPHRGLAPRSSCLRNRCPAFWACAAKKKMVVQRGNAPRSCGYRPRALLLSYRTCGKEMAAGDGVAPSSRGPKARVLLLNDPARNHGKEMVGHQGYAPCES